MKQQKHQGGAAALALLLSLTLLIIFHSLVLAEEPAAPTGTRTDVRLAQSGPEGLAFRLTTAPFAQQADGTIAVDGLQALEAAPGRPALPYYSTFIAVPPEARVSVTVEAIASETRQGIDVAPVASGHLAPVSESADWLPTVPDGVTAPAAAPERDLAVYGADAFYPAAAYERSAPQYWRDWRLVELKLFPLRYNPARQTLEQATELAVQVRFEGAAENQTTAPPITQEQEAWLSANVLNYRQGGDWRHWPQDTGATGETAATRLPVGVNTFRIEVVEDGIYEITGAELAAQGMNIAGANPNQLQMMQRGQPVAFDFIDRNGNGSFDPADGVRFYGWAFNGSRHEKLFVDKNVFWLWAGGTATPVTDVNNGSGGGFQTITTFPEKLTFQPEENFFSAWAINWDHAPNDPVAYHWKLIQQTPPTPSVRALDFDVPNPLGGGAQNKVLVELTTRLNPFSGAFPSYTTKASLNNKANIGPLTWQGQKNLNMTGTVAGSAFLQPGEGTYPTNRVYLELTSQGAVGAEVYVTRVDVEYTRRTIAVDEQLIFGLNANGKYNYRVSGFNNGSAAQALVWDIGDPYKPVQIKLGAGDISGTSGSYTYDIRHNSSKASRYIATSEANVKKVAAISRYNGKSLDAPGGATWIAIAYRDFLPAAQQLAGHRGAEMSTFVADVEDVINQFGYGLHTPDAIRAYLQHALANWAQPPSYVTLIGHATVNPRQISCANCDAAWNSEKTHIVTDMVFNDRWAGLIPSDFTMSLLTGSDLLPDIAIARLPAKTAGEAGAMVAKIINYENQRLNNPQPWHNNFLFVADDTDSGGDFCYENEKVAGWMTQQFNPKHLCLPTPTQAATNALRASMSEQINDVGISVLNYRGHGSRTKWADTSGAPPILAAAEADFWLNSGRPVIILSADCLDGYFATPGLAALGESFISLNGRGSVAHWSSSGLGYSTEHTVLHTAFYQGLFRHNLVRIGDTVNYAKVEYHQAGQYPSELYSFILLGDAAMRIMPYVPQVVHLPLAIRP